MSLQNRVTPFGEIASLPARGLFMGNRGGRIHDPETRALLPRRFASRQWICCVLSYKRRCREVMGHGYTELFFLDEVTALAAGHRPCFECRRADAAAFAAAWARAQGLSSPPHAQEMDRVLHAERLSGRAKRLHMRDMSELPDGAMIARGSEAFAVRGDTVWRWTPGGYVDPVVRPAGGPAIVLTPPAILAALGAGYAPHWHPGGSA